MQVHAPISAAVLKIRLDLLGEERTAAAASGLDSNDTYMRDLEDEATAVHAAYVGAAVTEIAMLRARLGGPLQG